MVGGADRRSACKPSAEGALRTRDIFPLSLVTLMRVFGRALGLESRREGLGEGRRDDGQERVHGHALHRRLVKEGHPYPVEGHVLLCKKREERDMGA